jgi:hypothetical protein
MTVLVTMAVRTGAPFTQTTLNLILLMWATIALLYFVVLKRSKFRTPGYRLGRVAKLYVTSLRTLTS